MILKPFAIISLTFLSTFSAIIKICVQPNLYIPLNYVSSNHIKQGEASPSLLPLTTDNLSKKLSIGDQVILISNLRLKPIEQAKQPEIKTTFSATQIIQKQVIIEKPQQAKISIQSQKVDQKHKIQNIQAKDKKMVKIKDPKIMDLPKTVGASDTQPTNKSIQYNQSNVVVVSPESQLKQKQQIANMLQQQKSVVDSSSEVNKSEEQKIKTQIQTQKPLKQSSLNSTQISVTLQPTQKPVPITQLISANLIGNNLNNSILSQSNSSQTSGGISPEDQEKIYQQNREYMNNYPKMIADLVIPKIKATYPQYLLRFKPDNITKLNASYSAINDPNETVVSYNNQSYGVKMSPKLYAYKQSVYLANVNKMNIQNSMFNKSYVQGLSEFSDLTNEQFTSIFTTKKEHQIIDNSKTTNKATRPYPILNATLYNRQIPNQMPPKQPVDNSSSNQLQNNNKTDKNTTISSSN